MRRVLFIGPLPEPVTGQSLACKVFLDELSNSCSVDVVNLSKREFRQGISSFGRIAQVLSILWRVWRKRRSPSVIYFTISESTVGNLRDLLVYAACFRQLRRMVIHLHGGAGLRQLISRERPLFRSINGLFLRRLGGVIVLGARHVGIFSDCVPAARIYVVPNFAPDALFLSLETIGEKFANVAPLRILFLSNLLPGKGHIELLQGIRMLDSRTRSLLAVDFAGGFESDDQKRDFLAALAQISEARYHGVVNGPEKIRLFAQAHVFCLPTYYPYEGQPISILEAYASGCAVLTTDHSGIFDIFSAGVNGFAVEKRSPRSIADALERALLDVPRIRAFAFTNNEAARAHYRASQYNANLQRVLDAVAGVDDAKS